MLFDKLIQDKYREALFSRNDNPYGVFYFSAADFPGLQAHPYSFAAKAGHTLNGWFYHYENPIPGRIVVFDHGMGNGHRAYMKEIEKLASAGYLVFSYDHTGCMESGGAHTNGFGQSLCDLDDCITALKAEPALAGRSFSVMGHSWGGFSTMNIVALHPDITHVVSMSGFISVRRMIRQIFSGLTQFFRKGVLALEQQANPDCLDCDAVNALKNTAARVLLVYSADDSVVSKAHHFDVLHQELAGCPNIRFRLEQNKDHSPNYTVDAAAYKGAFFAAFEKATKKGLLNTKEQQAAFMSNYDWERMTAQDPDVWKEILDTLNT